MEVQGPTASIQTDDGNATVTLFFDNVTGQPTRVATVSSTSRAYKVELEGPAPQTLVFLIPAGSTSRAVPNQVAREIDVRADVDGVLTNTSVWTLRLDV